MNKMMKQLMLGLLLALLLVPAVVFAQEQAVPERGMIEFGFRGVDRGSVRSHQSGGRSVQ